jgi:hypothetical protein
MRFSMRAHQSGEWMCALAKEWASQRLRRTSGDGPEADIAGFCRVNLAPWRVGTLRTEASRHRSLRSRAASAARFGEREAATMPRFDGGRPYREWRPLSAAWADDERVRPSCRDAMLAGYAGQCARACSTARNAIACVVKVGLTAAEVGKSVFPAIMTFGTSCVMP